MKRPVRVILRVGGITLVIFVSMAHMWAVVVQIICVAFASLEMTKFRSMFGLATLMISFFSAVGIGVLLQEGQPQPIWLWVLVLLPVGLLAMLGLLRLVDLR